MGNREWLIENKKNYYERLRDEKIKVVNEAITDINNESENFIKMLIEALLKADVKNEKLQVEIDSLQSSADTIESLEEELTIAQDRIEDLKDTISVKKDRIAELEDGCEKQVVVVNDSSIDIGYYERRDALLTSLEQGGVDNWSWYGESQEYYMEFLKENYPKYYEEEFGD